MEFIRLVIHIRVGCVVLHGDELDVLGRLVLCDIRTNGINHIFVCLFVRYRCGSAIGSDVGLPELDFRIAIECVEMRETELLVVGSTQVEALKEGMESHRATRQYSPPQSAFQI